MTNYKITVSNGYPSCTKSWEEQRDPETLEQFIQDTWEQEAANISVTAEIIPDPEPVPNYADPDYWTDDAIQDLAYSIASDSEGSMSGLYKPEFWDKIPKDIQKRIEEDVYGYCRS